MEVFEGGAFDLGDMGPDAEDGNGASEFKRERWVVWIWIWPLVNGRTVVFVERKRKGRRKYLFMLAGGIQEKEKGRKRIGKQRMKRHRR